MANTVENPSWLRERIAHAGYWLKDRGLQLTSVTLPLALVFSSAWMATLAGTGVGSYIVDSATNNILDPNDSIAQERAQSLKVGRDLLGEVRGAWRWNPLRLRDWNLFAPPRIN